MILLLFFINTAFAQIGVSCTYPCTEPTYTNPSSSLKNALSDLGRDRTDPIHAYSKENQDQILKIDLSTQQLQLEAQARFQDTYGKSRIHQLSFNEMQETARKYLDIVVGVDPIGCLTRSSYEWLTATNLVTKRPLTRFEHGVAFMGIVTLGGEAPVLKLLAFAKSASHLFNVHQMELAMAYGRILLKSSVGHVYTLIHTVGHIRLNEGVKAFNQNHVAFRHNQIFARVLPKSAITNIISGTKGLSEEKEAFITLYNDIKSFKHDPYFLAERLSLYQDEALTQLRQLDDSFVLVKFKLKELKEIPLEDLKKYRGYIPGGQTLGGATEYIIPSDALSQGLIDRTTFEVEELF